MSERAGVVTGADLRVHYRHQGVAACGAVDDGLGVRTSEAPASVTCSTCLAGAFLACRSPVGAGR